jgi:hypothetical protein
MSVYIKDMEMPISCWDCYFQDCGNCRLNAHKVVDKCIIEDRVDNDCPLIPVPDHGRLIDADELPFVESENGRQDDYVFRYDINEMPTIIPADKEGE